MICKLGQIFLFFPNYFNNWGKVFLLDTTFGHSLFLETIISLKGSYYNEGRDIFPLFFVKGHYTEVYSRSRLINQTILDLLHIYKRLAVSVIVIKIVLEGLPRLS